jgi:hypothetical protein
MQTRPTKTDRATDSCASKGKFAAWWTTKATIITKQEQDCRASFSSSGMTRSGSKLRFTACQEHQKPKPSSSEAVYEKDRAQHDRND